MNLIYFLIFIIINIANYTLKMKCSFTPRSLTAIKNYLFINLNYILCKISHYNMYMSETFRYVFYKGRFATIIFHYLYHLMFNYLVGF